jgi:hypothetical protein
MSERERVKLDDENTENEATKVATGAYLRQAKIVSVEDWSNYPGMLEPKQFDSGWTPEMCLILVVDDGFKKDKNIFLTGRFNRDKDTGVINGWNTWNNAIHRLLKRIADDVAEMNKDNFSIPKDVLDALIGRSFQFVRYITAETYTNDQGEEKPSYADWDKVFAVDESVEVIKEEFSKECEWIMSDKRNPKYRYDPSAIDSYSRGDTNFDYGENSKKGVKTSPEDDIPDEEVI